MTNLLRTVLVVMLMVIATQTNAGAALVTYEFTGTVSDSNFGMRDPLNLFNIGDAINGAISFDDNNAVSRIRYEIGTSGNYFSYEINDFTGRIANVASRLPDAHIYAFRPAGTGPMDNWTLLYDDTTPSGNKIFLHYLADASGMVFNFETKSLHVVPIPGALVLLGSGLLGAAGIRFRSKIALR